MMLFGFLGTVILFSFPLPAERISNNGSEKDIYIGALFPMTKYWWAKYAQILPPLFNYAAQEIHNRSDILPGYRLNLVLKDTQGVPGLAIKRYQEMVTEPPAKIAVLGPCSSNEALVVGQVSHHYNMVEMMFIARTSTLSDRKSFQGVYMTNYLAEIFNPPRIAMMKYFGWTKVATLSMTEDLFAANIDNFHTLLELNNFTLVTSGIITDVSQVAEHIQRLKHYDARIIVGAFYGSHAPYIFCEAYRQGLYGDQFVWILPLDMTFQGWISKVKLDDLSCTMEEIREAGSGFFTLDNDNLGNSNRTTISGKTPRMFQRLVKDLQDDNMFVSSAIPYAYDAVWALALALNETMSRLPSNVSLGDFVYNDPIIYQTLRSQLDTLLFQGVSGSVSFGSEGQRIGLTYVYQTIGDQRRMVASYSPLTDSLTWNVNPKSLWKGGRTPRDEFTYVTVYPRLDTAAVKVMMALNTLGVINALSFLGFNIAFRRLRTIKMSSPNINNIVILGSLVMYATVYLNSVELWDIPPHHTTAMCMPRVWITSIGFTLLFGSLFSKIWRVHILFRHQKLKKKAVRDEKLMGLVAFLVIIDLCILIPWQVYHPLEERHTRIMDQGRREGDVISIDMYIVCHSAYKTYWMAATYVYKGLLLAFGTFLAWETRKVTIPVLNDSRQIGFCVYNVVIICAFAVPVNHVLGEDQSTLRFVISSAFTVFCTTLVLCIVFIPKILKRNDKTKLFLQADGSTKPRDTCDQSNTDHSTSDKGKGQSKVYPGTVGAPDSFGTSTMLEKEAIQGKANVFVVSGSSSNHSTVQVQPRPTADVPRDC